MVSALDLASASHLYTALTGQPAILMKIPGLIAMVTGSMGFCGVHALAESDTLTSLNLMTDMLLAIGLLLADNITPLLFARLKRH